MTVKNATSLPKRFYGLHMVEGLAEYSEPTIDSKPYRILIVENALKQMDASFEGRPVYVRHVNEVNLDQLQATADGYVVKSFYNPADGKHWVEFMVVSDRGHEAIAKGWKLSNAYLLKETIGGGKWHNVDYTKEVVRGEYEHLAIVPDPRYEESVILTPDEFKAYNSEKETELKRLANSKEEKRPMKFNLFKKTPVENSDAILEGAVLTLKNGREISVADLIKNAEANPDMFADPASKETPLKGTTAPAAPAAADAPEKVAPMMANGEHMVQVGNDLMSVNALVEKHMAMLAPKNEGKADKDGMVDLEKMETEGAEKKTNKEDKDEDKDAKEKAEKKENSKKEKEAGHFDKLKNAAADATLDAPIHFGLSDKVALGKSRYGSK